MSDMRCCLDDYPLEEHYSACENYMRFEYVRKKKVDKAHQDYPEYIKKCKAISEKHLLLEKDAEDECLGWRGLDHPASEKIRAIKKQYNVELKALQQEYAHIFTED